MDSINAAVKAAAESISRQAEHRNAEQMRHALESIEASLDQLNGRPADVRQALVVAARSLALVRRTERMLASAAASTVTIAGDL
jgi:hypothetical protein